MTVTIDITSPYFVLPILALLLWSVVGIIWLALLHDDRTRNKPGWRLRWYHLLGAGPIFWFLYWLGGRL